MGNILECVVTKAHSLDVCGETGNHFQLGGVHGSDPRWLVDR